MASRDHGRNDLLGQPAEQPASAGLAEPFRDLESARARIVRIVERSMQLVTRLYCAIIYFDVQA